MIPELRPYQNKLLDDIDDAFLAGARNVLAVLPTGGGKTVTFAERVRRETQPVLVQVHRTELVSQISMTLARFGVYHRLIAPTATIRSIRNEHYAAFGKTFDNPTASAAIASVDTLIPRAESISHYLGQVGLTMTDEAAHVQQDNKWGAALRLTPGARSIGFTATPKRADGRGLGAASGDGVYDTMVRGPSVAELMAMGFLSRYRIIAAKSDIDVSDIRITATGDYSNEQLRLRSHQSHIVGDVVREYLRHAAGLQGITFTVDVETAVEIAAQYNAQGVPAAAVSAKTPEAERQKAVHDFRAGKLKQLTNCDLFGEGFDVPGVKVVSSARPSMSLSLVLQQWGRGLRPDGTDQPAILIDHVGNWERHGLPDSPRNWTLEGRARGKQQDPDIVALTSCLECFEVFERKLLPTCPHCGTSRDPAGRRAPEMVDGDLTELDLDALAHLRESVELPTPADIKVKVTHAAGAAAGKAAYKNQANRIAAQTALKDSIAIWAGTRKARGQSDKTSYREFFLTFGVDVLTAQTLPRVEMEELRGRVESGT